jgi:hypothetical protein
MINCPNCRVALDVFPGVPNDCPGCKKEFVVLAPQEGPQTDFLRMTDVDILVYGGAAGGGKSYGLLLEPIYDLQSVPGFGAVCFRRETPDITNEGGLWDTASIIYSFLDAKPRGRPKLQYVFPNKNKITFTHLQNERDKETHQGAQYPDILFDELTHFTETQFWYLVGRNRAPSLPQSVKRRVRATTNPDPGTWVKTFLAPWVDEQWPEEERAKPGEVLYLVRLESEYNYFKLHKEAMAFAKSELKLPEHEIKNAVKSVSFIPASIYDNKILIKNDPGYLASLLALNKVERERLLRGNWSITEDSFFDMFRQNTDDGKPWHVIPTDSIPEDLNYVMGVDWGFADPFCAVLIGIDKFRRATVCREIYVKRTRTAEQGNMMLEMLEDNGLLQKDVLIYAGHDVFNRRLRSNGEYEEPIVHTWQRMGFRVVSSGKDPLVRASKMREYLSDWGTDDLWEDGKPGIQIMDCCTNGIRTIPSLKCDAKRIEQIDTTMEDHWYDAVGHVLTSMPSKPKPKAKEEFAEDTRKKGSIRARFAQADGGYRRLNYDEYEVE